MARIHRDDPELCESISYRALLKHVALRGGCPLGFGKARTQTDKCAVCTCWDEAVAKRLRASFREATATLQHHCEDYFEGFPHPVDGSDGYACLEDPVFMESFSRYVAAHHETEAGRRHGLSAEEEAALAGCEHAVVHTWDDAAEGYTHIVREFQAHWAARDYLAEAKRRDDAYCLPGTLYIEEDFQENPLPHITHTGGVATAVIPYFTDINTHSQRPPEG